MSIEILGGLFVGCLVSGLIPVLNAELLVAGVAATAPLAWLPLVVVLSATGQMITKTTLFGLARWAPERLPTKARDAIARLAERAGRHGGAAAGTTILASSFIGLPPFYGVSLGAGALGVPARTFVTAGLLGRLARFGLLGWGAHELGTAVLGGLASTLFTAIGLGA